jgi:hypothetical protein
LKFGNGKVPRLPATTYHPQKKKKKGGWGSAKKKGKREEKEMRYGFDNFKHFQNT